MLLKLLGLLPGGGVLSLLGTAFSCLAKFLGWLLADIADAFKEPQRLLVRAACGIVVLGLGIHIGIERDADQVRKWKTAHAQLMKDAEIADAKNKGLLKAALQAKAEAEAKVMADAKPAPAAKPAAGLRKRRSAAGQNGGGGQGLSGFFVLSGKAY